jgi:hypothetical protein
MEEHLLSTLNECPLMGKCPQGFGLHGRNVFVWPMSAFFDERSAKK